MPVTPPDLAPAGYVHAPIPWAQRFGPPSAAIYKGAFSGAAGEGEFSKQLLLILTKQPHQAAN